MSSIQYCAPHVAVGIGVDDHFSCFNKDELTAIASALNINANGKSNRELWNDIYRTLETVCKYEWCWLDLDFVNNIQDKNLRRKIKYFTFKPKTTRGRHDWLSTKDIDHVLGQHQTDQFKFLGAHPADYAKMNEIHPVVYAKTRYVGIVFNLDTHEKRGSHWVALVIDNQSQTVEYFDSIGRKPNKYIREFIISVMSVNPFKKYKLLVNHIVHQKQNNECGVYAIYFIIRRINGDDFETITQKIVTDAEMNAYRDIIFRPLL